MEAVDQRSAERRTKGIHGEIGLSGTEMKESSRQKPTKDCCWKLVVCGHNIVPKIVSPNNNNTPQSKKPDF
jgi:hypothetical protein